MSARSIISLSSATLSVSEPTDPQTDSLRRRENVSGLRAWRSEYTHIPGREKTNRAEREIEKQEIQFDACTCAWVVTRECAMHIGLFFMFLSNYEVCFNTFTRHDHDTLRFEKTRNCRDEFLQVASKPILRKSITAVLLTLDPPLPTKHRRRWLQWRWREKSRNWLVVNVEQARFFFSFSRV